MMFKSIWFIPGNPKFEESYHLKFYWSAYDYCRESRSKLQVWYQFTHWPRFRFTGNLLEILLTSFIISFNLVISNYIFILIKFTFKVVDFIQCCEWIHKLFGQSFCNSFIFNQSGCYNMGYGIFSCLSSPFRMVTLWTWTKWSKVKCE